MRKFSLLSIFVFALSLAVVPFSSSEAQGASPKVYFGMSSGYSYQKLNAKGSVTLNSVTVSDAKYTENGFFLAPKLGVFLGESRVALEFEPRWTIGFYDIEAKASSGGSSIDVKVDGDTFHHLLFPLIAVVKLADESKEFSFGAGTGVGIYDVGDDVSTTRFIPLVGKMGFAVPISTKTQIGLDGQFSYSLWESDSEVDNIWSLSVGAVLQHKF